MKSLSFPQPLLTRGQIFQIRAAQTFSQLGAINSQIQHTEKTLSAAVAQFEAQLPEGYSLVTLPNEQCSSDEPLFACLDENRNDVGWPLTSGEAFDRAWVHSGLPKPSITDFPPYADAKSKLAELTVAAGKLGRALDRIATGTHDPEVTEGAQ